MTETLTEKLTNSPEGMRLYQQERASLELTELICEIMEKQNVNIDDLCHRLNYSLGKEQLRRMLDGRGLLLVTNASDILHALGKSLHFSVGPLRAIVGKAHARNTQERWEAADVHQRKAVRPDAAQGMHGDGQAGQSSKTE